MRRMTALRDYPQRHRVTAEEYVRMGEARVFAPQARLELMEGAIVDMAPIGSAHAAVVNALAGLMARVGERAIVSIQNPLVIGERSVPQPDLVLLRPRPDRYFGRHPTAADAMLVVEVSDTTLDFDIDVKVPLYAAAGIAEVWIVDIERRAVRVFRDPSGGLYENCTIVPRGEAVGVSHLDGFSVAVAELFPQSAEAG